MYASSQFIGAAEEEVAYGGKGRDRCIFHALELRSGVVHAGLFRRRIPIAFEEAVFVKVGEGIIVNVSVKVGTIGKALGIAGKPTAELGIVVAAAEVYEARGVVPLGCEEPGVVFDLVVRVNQFPKRSIAISFVKISGFGVDEADDAAGNVVDWEEDSV